MACRLGANTSRLGTTHACNRCKANIQRPHTRRVARSAQSGQGSTEVEGNAAFVAKLLVGSTAGGALAKYGSLLIDSPFEPDAGLAWGFVLGPCLISAALLLASSAQDAQQ